MAACLTEDELLSLVAESLSPDRVSEVETHLTTCAECRARLQALCQEQLAAHAAARDEGIGTSVTMAADTEAGAEPTSVGEEAAQERGCPGSVRHSIEGYEIQSEIHRGGQGVVYRSYQKSTKRTVAVKVLLQGPYASERQRRRFEREIDLIAQLKHSNIVTVYDSGVTQDGRHYYAMEYVHGLPLDQYLFAQDLSIDDRLTLFVKVCRAVAYAHRQGVIHRDLKPANIRVDSDGEPHVLDFGLAKMAGTDYIGDGTPVTFTGEFMGTLAYASPEQARGDTSSIDVRTDVYSLGVVLYRVMTGMQPYPLCGNLAEMIRRITEDEPTAPSGANSELTNDIDTVVLKALTKERDRRYQSAGELARDIERILAGLPIEAKRDSLGYVAATRTRRFVCDHPHAMKVVGAILAAAFAHWCITPLVMMTPTYPYLSRMLTTYVGGTAATSAFEKVVVIGITDETDIEGIAQREGLDGVRVAHATSLRRLHGRMMETLVGAGVGVLTWDIRFPGNTEFDEDFAAGARALRESGVDVIVPVKPDEVPLSAVIVPDVLLGIQKVNFGASAPWYLHLVRGSLAEGYTVSLVLRSVVSYWLPGSEIWAGVDLRARDVIVWYWEPEGDPDDVLDKERGHARITLTEYSPDPGAEKAAQFEEQQDLAYVLVTMPETPVLHASTVDYAEVFQSSPEELEDRLGDKIVVVGDIREGVDRHEHPDGRSLSGCYGHATVIDAILRGACVRAPPARAALGMNLAAALLGLPIAAWFSTRRWRRCAAFALVAIIFVAASLSAFRFSQFFVIPIPEVVAVILSCELAVVVARVQRRGHSSRA